jgi:hypothetical protein
MVKRNSIYEMNFGKEIFVAKLQHFILYKEVPARCQNEMV